MTDFNLLTLLMFLLSAGGHDLVHYIPTQSYWEMKGVEVTVDAILPELDIAPPTDIGKAIDDLGAADATVRDAATQKIIAAGPAALSKLDPEAKSDDVEVARRVRALIVQIRSEAKPKELRHLLAIRTLGELKDPRALPALKRWTLSAEPFAAEYAQVAIATINATPAPVRQPDPKAMASDIELLPEACAAVGQIRLAPGLAPPFPDAIAQMELPEQPRQTRLRQISNLLIDTAERLGNLRVDGVTFGISGDFDGQNGYVVAVVRGQYDPDIARLTARVERFAATPVGNQVIYQWGPESHAFMPSTDRLVFFSAPGPQSPPAPEMIKALAAGKGTLHSNAELTKLIDAADTSQPIWVAARPTPTLQRTLPFLNGLDVLRITSAQQADTLKINAFATGPDAQRVASAAKTAEILIKESLPDLEKYAGFMPPLRPARDLLKGVRIQPADTAVTGAATWKGSLTSLYLFSMYPYTLPADAPPEK